MLTAKTTAIVFFPLLLFSSCTNPEKEQKAFQKKLDQIEAIEHSIDSTVSEVKNKTKEVEEILEQLDNSADNNYE